MENYGDNVILQRNFWNKTANQYLNYPDHDVTYLQKLLVTAAHWEQKYNEYLAHLKVTNTSYHLN
jgi:hypothetical protein